MSPSGKLKMKREKKLNQFENILLETVLLFTFAREVKMRGNGEGKIQELHSKNWARKNWLLYRAK